MNLVSRFLTSPANWCGIGLATVALAPQALGLALWGGWLLAPLGYGAGFAAAGLWFGYPRLTAQPWDDLEFDDQGDARQAMDNALEAVRGLVNFNPDDRLSARVLELCSQLRTLLAVLFARAEFTRRPVVAQPCRAVRQAGPAPAEWARPR